MTTATFIWLANWVVSQAAEENKELLEAVEKASNLARKGPLQNFVSMGEKIGTVYKILIVVVGAAIAFFLLKFLYNILFGGRANARYLKQYRKTHEENLTPYELEQKALALESRGNHQESAETYLKAGDPKSAAACYQRAGEPTHATTILMKAGLYSDAAEIYMQLKKHKEAARCLSMDGHYREAAEEMLKAGDAKEAARSFEQIGESERAADLYASQGVLQKAADLYGACGRKDKQAKVIEELMKQGPAPAMADRADIEKALEECNKFESAANLYLKKGDFVKAIVDLVRGGEVDKATEVFHRIHEKPVEEILNSIARFDTETVLKFAQFFLKVRDKRAAAHIFDNIGRYREAGALAEQFGDYYYAGQMYQMAGDIPGVALAMERAKSWTEAAQAYQETGNELKAADMYYLAGKFETALPFYRKLGNREKTLLCCKAMNGPSAGKAGELTLAEACAEVVSPQVAARHIRDSVIGLETLAPLSKSRFVANLTPDEVNSVHMYVHKRDVPAGSVIIEDGTKSGALYMIASGKVEVYRISDSQKIILASLGPGEHFGEISALLDRPATAVVAATVPTTLLYVGDKDLKTLMVSNPVIGLKLSNIFLNVLSDRLARTNELVDTIQLETV
jgi:tetratricopeptide (TPR) repeat protein